MEPNNQPVMNMGMPAEHKKVGPVIAILVIVLVLIIGALYIFASRGNQSAIPTDNTTADTNSDGTVPTVNGNSDDVTSLQSDLDVSTKGLDNQNF